MGDCDGRDGFGMGVCLKRGEGLDLGVGCGCGCGLRVVGWFGVLGMLGCGK